MDQDGYIAPEFNKEAFHCPHCDVGAHQIWKEIGVTDESDIRRFVSEITGNPNSALTLSVTGGDVRSDIRTLIHSFLFRHVIPDTWVSRCQICKNYSYWIQEKLIYPAKITAPLAHKDMPGGVQEYYNEARTVSVHSSRAAAALLRIAAKKLCEELGEQESNLYRAIGNLSKRGLPQAVIRSLDTVRIVGNEGGAHEGQIDLTGEDNQEIVNRLFWLINFIVEKTITEPAEVEDIFSSLPKNQKEAAERRDNQQ